MARGEFIWRAEAKMALRNATARLGLVISGRFACQTLAVDRRLDR
jgi:hypothetical protein